MNIIALVIDLVCGAVGGNLAGSLLKNFNLGPVGNSIAGIVGGVTGGELLQHLTGVAANTGGLDLGSIVSGIVGGGVGGGIVLVIVGWIKNMKARLP
jgi:uncharacterized membrane protein YeaQ/YmgE (transglycosylase-associated protein family)